MNKKILHTNLTMKKLLLLFLSGVGLGLAMITMGWAKTLPAHHPKVHTSVKHAKAVQTKKPKKTTATVRRPVELKEYAHPNGLYQVSYPATWFMRTKQDGMIAVTRGQHGGNVIFGVLRRSDEETNEQAIEKELSAGNHPDDLVKMQARLAGLSATKLVGTGNRPDIKKVEYYVETQTGHRYFILMMAPKSEWEQHNIAFSRILNTLTLN
jgi:hypothetical protein